MKEKNPLKLGAWRRNAQARICHLFEPSGRLTLARVLLLLKDRLRAARRDCAKRHMTGGNVKIPEYNEF